jgi:hypothetical protein
MMCECWGDNPPHILSLLLVCVRIACYFSSSSHLVFQLLQHPMYVIRIIILVVSFIKSFCQWEWALILSHLGYVSSNQHDVCFDKWIML